MPCLQDKEFLTIDELIQSRLETLYKQETTKEARGHLLGIRHKLTQLKCKSARYAD